MDKTERWFNAFKAEADAFDIYGAGYMAAAADPNKTEDKYAAEVMAHIFK